MCVCSCVYICRRQPCCCGWSNSIWKPVYINVYVDFWRETALHLRHELAQRTAEVQRLKVEVAWAANQHGAGDGGGGGGGREVGDGRGGGRGAGGGRGGGGRERGRGGGGGGGRVSWWEGTELSRSWDAVASAIDGHTGADCVRLSSVKVTQLNGGGAGGGGGGGVFGQEKQNSVSSVKENFLTNELPIKAEQFANYFAHGGREAEKASDLSYSGASGIANTVNTGNTGHNERAEKASDLSHSLTASSVPSCVPKSSVPKLWKPAETLRANSLNSVTNSLNYVTNSLNSVTNSPKLRQLPRPTTTPPYAGHPSPREKGGGGVWGGEGMKMPLTQLTGNSQPPVVIGVCGGGGGGGGRGGGGNGREEWIQRVLPAELQFFR
jgi:hypothetical protein